MTIPDARGGGPGHQELTDRAAPAIGNARLLARRQHEEAPGIDRLRFLADAGALLPSTLDVEEALRGVARAAVVTLADWGVVYLVGEDGAIQRLAVAHADPAKEALAEELERRYPPEPTDGSIMWRVLRCGEPALLPEVTDALLAHGARDAEHLELMRRLGITSGIWLPLVARGRTLGVFGLFAAESGRRYTPDDLAVAQEIARRAALAVDTAQLYREAQDAIRARDEFLSIASHELRTPMATIKGVAQLLLRARSRGSLDDARLERLLRTLGRASDRLAELTDELLDVSRLRTGRLDLRPRALDLGQLVRETAERHLDHLTDRHTLTVELGEPCEVAADPDRLEQVLTNLLTNAVKYSPDGGPIEVTVRGDEGGVLVEVRDAGIGLPPGAEEAIFEPFGRAPNAALRQIPGMGLGLHIARDIMHRHDGRIWAESAGEDRGTTVRVWLPCAPPDPGRAPVLS